MPNAHEQGLAITHEQVSDNPFPIFS
ncbi:YozQ family protein [Brevibacillus brevis]|nr:DUF4025 domain-containing protein [Lysinibacillus sp. SDF0063]